MSDLNLPQVIEGDLVAPPGARFAIVASRFNELVVDRLAEGAREGLLRHGVEPERITLVRVPGAWELSLATQRLAKSGRFDAIIACGAVIRGATAHFDYVAGEAARGVAAATTTTGVPVIFGVLTTDTIEQALERAGTKAGNKGFDSALAALEMVTLGRRLTEFGL
ncbi:MAG: 6,7-dimethyl-8-ribityllumazine synthase [Myxococcales bacterium]|nr:6,7-dimethyl-8-ribityllumazine synthase [Myxococcales bacterium]